MTTLKDLIDRTEVTIEEHLDVEALVPTSDGLQAQGDLVIVPATIAAPNGATVRNGAAWVDVPTKGIVVLAGNHDHVLIADEGTCRWTTDVADSAGLALGAVEAEAPVWLLHPEHGGIGLAPGRYVLRGTREMAAEIRRVAD